MKLYPNQEELIDKIRYREDHKVIELGGDNDIQTNMSIISDLPGRGRKVSIRKLITDDEGLCERTSIDCTSVRGEGAQIISFKRVEKIPTSTTLIITKDIDAWKCVLENDLNVHIIKTRADILLDDHEYNVIVCSKDLYNYFARENSRYMWKRFVYDNPIETYIPKMKTVSANFYWILTHDPLLLISSTRKRTDHFLSKLFCNMSPIQDKRIIEALCIKSTEGWREVLFTKHIAYDIDEDHALVPHMMESKKIVPLITLLGGKLIDDVKVYVESQYRFDLIQIQQKINMYSTGGHSAHKVDKWENKKIELNKSVIYNTTQIKHRLEHEHCSICFEKFESPSVVTCCNQLFCGHCVLKCLFAEKSCPLCRTEIGISNIRCIVDNHTDTLNYIRTTFPTRMKHIHNFSSSNMVIYSRVSLDGMLRGYNIPFNKRGMLYYIGQHIDSNANYNDLILYDTLSRYEKQYAIGMFNGIERENDLTVHEFNI